MEKTDKFNMRVSPAFLGLIDEWRRRQPDIPSRAEAIRRLVVAGLDREVIDKVAALGLALALTHMDKMKESEVKTFRNAAFELLQSGLIDGVVGRLDGISVSDISDFVDKGAS
ncbi:hypothetical protein [Phaeospirillum tilakii]|uniref:Ribbon-helix-helix protein, copG family n=1 Tax=Phaeospirillum tilakii TaxID=741673 RepID=A0ABW5CHB1_9PROT